MEVKTVFKCNDKPDDFLQVIYLYKFEEFILSVVEYEMGEARVILTRDQLKELKKTIEVLIGEK